LFADSGLYPGRTGMKKERTESGWRRETVVERKRLLEKNPIGFSV
jgi:hypothetical protein